MNDQFTSLEKLFQRVSPALRARKAELERFGYYYVTDMDIWNYLVDHKWKMAQGLMLSDIVNDIMNVSVEDIMDDR